MYTYSDQNHRHMKTAMKHESAAKLLQLLRYTDVCPVKCCPDATLAWQARLEHFYNCDIWRKVCADSKNQPTKQTVRGLNPGITSLQQFEHENVFLSSMTQVGVWIRWPLGGHFPSKNQWCCTVFNDIQKLLSGPSENPHLQNPVKISWSS